MRNTIQIQNLGYSMDDRDLARLFAPYGTVHSATISTRFDSAESTGSGVVVMESGPESESAIAALHGSTHCNRVLSVQPIEEAPAKSPDMFGPMNIPDAPAQVQTDAERRDLV